MHVNLFNFDLPESRIALRPVSPRDSAKMLVVEGKDFLDRQVTDITNYFRKGDAIVVNDTKVIPAQLQGVRIRDGVTAQVLATLHTRLSPDRWLCFVKGAKKLKPKDRIRFGVGNTHCGSLDCQVIAKHDSGDVELQFDLSGAAFDKKLAQTGSMPLPPYIAARRGSDENDTSDYQTMYANEAGAVAAPTAGLHFTPELMEKLQQKGVECHHVTLHVGPGTFLPMKVEDTTQHKMHSEWGRVSQETADALNAVRKNGGRIISIGTTSLRLLESAASADGQLRAYEGETDIFITPGYTFKAVDMLMTNFHLPKSTLFMLVSAFCGLETMRSAYEHAIANEYRFYSYGDASLL